MPPDQDGEPSRAAYEYILLHLTEPLHLEHAKDETFLTRSILFDSKQPTIKVGRSSKTISKKLLPAEENAYFDSPVVSREHAEITADLEKGALHLTDTGSMHGTALNECPIKPSTPTLIKSGDVIRFGVHVARGLDVFFPTECRVDISMKPAAKASYQAPDPIDLSDDKSDCSDLNHSQTDSDSSYSNGADADTTMRGDTTLQSEALSAHVHKGDNAILSESVVAFTYRDSESDSDDSDFEMEEEDEEEEEEEEDEESDDSVIEDEGDLVDLKYDDGGDFLAFELDRYNEQPAVTEAPGNVETEDLSKPDDADPLAGEGNPAGDDDQDHDNDASTDVNADVDAGADADTDADAKADADTDADAKADADVDANADANAHTDADAVANADASADVDADVAADVDATADVDVAADVDVDAVSDVNANNTKGRMASKKRKAEDMLVHVAVADDLPTQTKVDFQDAPPAAKRQATTTAVSAATVSAATVSAAKSKRRGVMWAVAEKVGVAALGGAVVLGSLIYTAPSF